MCHSMAIIYDKQGKFPEAFELFQKCIATQEMVLGCECLEVAVTKFKYAFYFRFLTLLNIHVLRSIGVLFQAHNKHKDALTILEEVLRCKELGPEHLLESEIQNRVATLAIMCRR